MPTRKLSMPVKTLEPKLLPVIEGWNVSADSMCNHPFANCNNCKVALCSIKIALKKGWVIGPGRSFKTAEQVIEDSTLVCSAHCPGT